MKLKKVVSLALAGAMVLGLAACGGKETGKQDVKLVMWGAEEDQAMLQEMVDSFIELHKDEVNLTYSFADDQVMELVQAGALMAIPDEMGRKEIEERNASGSVVVATVDGKLYAYPRTADNGYYLIYNKEYLTEEDVASWESMLAKAASVGKKVTMEMNAGWAMKLADWITNEENQIKSYELRGNGPSSIKAAESDTVKSNVAIAAFAMTVSIGLYNMLDKTLINQYFSTLHNSVPEVCSCPSRFRSCSSLCRDFMCRESPAER